MSLILPVLLLVTACGMSEERFTVDGLQRLCEQEVLCAENRFDLTACVDHVRATDRSGCDYDPKAARACYRALDTSCTPGVLADPGALTSPELCQECKVDEMGIATLALPSVCAEVYPDCPALFVPY